jgi:hypothetical protein
MQRGRGRVGVGRAGLCAWEWSEGLEMLAKLETGGVRSVTAAFATQIELDASGVLWLADTKVKVTEVVLDKIAWGWSPEEIHFQHPHLSLAQIYARVS